MTNYYPISPRCLFLFLLLCLSTSTFAQQWAWVNNMGSPKIEMARTVVTDQAGNSWITGYFTSSVPFKGVNKQYIPLTSSGKHDAFLAKYQANGNLEWVAQIGGKANDYGRSIALTPEGYAIVLGYFEGQINLTTPNNQQIALNSSGDSDIFMAKYDPNGQLVWAKQLGGKGTTVGYDIAIDEQERIWVVGTFDDQLMVGKKKWATRGASDAFIAQFNAKGSLQWLKQIGGHGEDTGLGIAVDQKEHAYITGSFEKTATFGDLLLQSKGKSDVFVAQYDEEGHQLWLQQIGGEQIDVGYDIVLDAAENVAITGFFEKTSIWNKQLKKAVGETDWFIAQYDDKGRRQWWHHAGGVGEDKAFGIAPHPKTGYLITGTFEQRITFKRKNKDDLVLKSKGGQDIFVTHYSPKGKVLNAYTIGGKKQDKAYSISSHPNGRFWVAGSLEDKVKLNKWNSITTAGKSSSDLFLAQFHPSSSQPFLNPSFTHSHAIVNQPIQFSDDTKAFPPVHTWEWQLGDGSISTLPMPAHTYSDYGVYSVSLTVSNGQLTETHQRTLRIEPPEMKAGLWQWAKAINNDGEHQAIDVALDQQNQLWTLSNFTNSIQLPLPSIMPNPNFINPIDMRLVEKLTDSLTVAMAQWQADSLLTDSLLTIYTDSLHILHEQKRLFLDHPNDSISELSFQSKGQTDVLLTKCNPNNGEVTWATTIKGNDWDEATAMTTNANDLVWVTGYFKGMLSIDTNFIIAKGNKDAFIAQFDAKGQCQWLRQIGGIGWDIATTIVADESNEVIVAGTFDEELLLEGQDRENILLQAVDGEDIFIAKFNASGELIWATAANGQGIDQVSSIALDPKGNFWLTGSFEENIQIGTTKLQSKGFEDAFIAHFDASGEAIWAISAGGDLFDAGTSVAVDAKGNGIVVGNFWGTATFSPDDEKSLTAQANKDVFIAKYNRKGKLLWVQQAKSEAAIEPQKVMIQKNDNIVLTGAFEQKMELEYMSLESRGGKDVFVAAYTPDGSILWAKQAGGKQNDMGYGLAQTTPKQLWLFGDFETNIQLGKNGLKGTGKKDCFIGKYELE